MEELSVTSLNRISHLSKHLHPISSSEDISISSPCSGANEEKSASLTVGTISNPDTLGDFY